MHSAISIALMCIPSQEHENNFPTTYQFNLNIYSMSLFF